MQQQDTTRSWQADGGGVRVPLGLEGLRVISQRVGPAGELEVTVIGTQPRATCPRCGRVSAKQHDVRRVGIVEGRGFPDPTDQQLNVVESLKQIQISRTRIQ